MRIEKIIKILGNELSIKVEKRGSNFFFLCPFHKDKNPSLGLESKRMFFNCFGCEFKARNIYDFWSKYKKISLESALDEIADLGYITKRNFGKKTSNFDYQYSKFLDLFSDLYMNNLQSTSGKDVFEYLTKKRKIKKEILEFFKIGSSFSSNQISEILRKKENKEAAKAAIDLKLIIEKNDIFSDFFWSKQVIFPIENENGEVITVASRKIYEQKGKYVFLPSSTCEKSSILYNYWRVKNRNEDFFYLVEGFFDVISMHQLGIKNVMSLLGTSMSEIQKENLIKLKKRIIIFFDGDEAGIESSITISSKLIQNEIDCQIINKKNFDPDELCKNNKKEEFDNILKELNNPLSFSINYYYEKFNLKENPQRTQIFVSKISEIFYLASENIKNFLVEKISQILKVDKENIEKMFLKNFFVKNVQSLLVKNEK